MRFRFYSAFETAMSTFYSDLIPFLAARGHEVEVIISQAEYRPGRDLEGALGSDEKVRVVRTRSLGIEPRGAPRTALVMLLYLVHMALYTLRPRGKWRNVFLTTPPLLPLWGYFLNLVRGDPYYCVMMDVYPDLLVSYGRLQAAAPVTRLFDWLARLSLRRAEGIIVIGRCMADVLVARGVPRERLHVIPNWMNEHQVYPVQHERNPFRKEHGLERRFVVLYSGNMGAYHHFDDLLAAAAQLRDEEGIAFVLIGGGARREEIAARVQAQGLTNVTLLPFQEVSKLPLSLSAGDLHLVTLADDCTGLAVPSKSYGILAAGRPILYQGSRDGEIARLIEEERIGTVLPIGDAAGLTEAIRDYAANPERARREGCRARNLAVGRYSRQSALQRYEVALAGHPAGATQPVG